MSNKKNHTPPLSPAQIAPNKTKKVFREKVWFWILLVVFLIFSFVEWLMLSVSAQLPVATSVLFFLILNLNVIIALVLIFLSIRHVFRFIFSENTKVFGRQLKVRLLAIFSVFAILPIALIFLVSYFYIHASFDQWFKHQVVKSVSDSVDLTVYYYDIIKKILVREKSVFSKQLQASSGELVDCSLLWKNLIHTDWALVLDSERNLICHWSRNPQDSDLTKLVPKLRDEPPSLIRAENGEYLYDFELLPNGNKAVLGFLIPAEYAEKMAKVIYLSQDLKNLNPYGTQIKTVYTISLIAVTALLIFSFLWIGIHLADRLTKPLNEIAGSMSGFKELGIKRLPLAASELEEIRVVKKSYNHMIDEWENTKLQLEKALENLKELNLDLDLQKRFVELVLNDLDSAIVLVNSQGELLFYNKAFEKFRDAEEGTRSISSIHSELQKMIFKSIHGTESKNLKTPERTVKDINVDAENRSYEIIIQSLSLKRSDDKLILAILHDLTDVQQEQALVAWKEVAKRVAHEIKNPLTPIQLLTERLLRRIEKTADISVEDLKETCTTTLYHVDVIKNLISEFSKVANLPSVHLVLGSPNTLVDRLSEIYEPLCDQNAINFSVEIENHIPPFFYDQNAILQVFGNLIHNAIQAIQSQNTVKPSIKLVVRYNKRLQLMRFDLIDNGPGIDPSHLGRVFSPTFTTKEKGMGLGLSISKKIVEDHGGRIQVLPGLDDGTRFVVELPVYRQKNDPDALSG